MKTIETPRLLLRPFTLDDIDASIELNSDPKVMQYIVGEGEPTRENVRSLIEDRTLLDYEKYGYGRHAIVHKADNRMIGFTGLKYLDDLKEVDVGYRLHSDYWRQGLAYEATQPTVDWGFNELGLKRIVAGALPGNAASIALMKKLGMHFEKTFLEEGHEMVMYAIEKP